MKSSVNSRVWTAALVFSVAVAASVIAVSIPGADAEPTGKVLAPADAPPPAEASAAIGKPPKKDSPSADEASVLGTVFAFRGGARRVEVQATSVDTRASSSAKDTRTVRVEVNYRAVAGEALVNELDFAMLDQDGKQYSSEPAKSSGDVPDLGNATLAPSRTAKGAVFFEVPNSASMLVLVYQPAPSKKIVGRWLLAAP